MSSKISSISLANLFSDSFDDENIIFDVFNELGFDCILRTYVDPNELDKRIALFHNEKSAERLASVIELIQTAKSNVDAKEASLVNEIKSYIIEGLSDSVTFEQVAGTFNISYYYMCHIFKKVVGKSPNQFRTEKRLERSCRLLLENKQKISDIAILCGFESISYFSEIFKKYIGESPSDFRKNHKGCYLHDFYTIDDILLAVKLEHTEFMTTREYCKDNGNLPYVHVHDPGDEFGYFLHESAIIEYEGVLYASWYNCKKNELVGYTPIAGRRSYDGGKTWTDAEIIAEDKTEKILYCPPVYGICDGKLYMLMNQMVSADHMHALDLFVLNKGTDKFEFLWSRPIPFKLNTNVVQLPNGKLMLPGRIAELDGFPVTPAVMISDSGKIDAEWRVVRVAENGGLPDGSSYVHPETTLICCDDLLYLFNRNDRRNVPIVYVSRDFGETWSEPMAHDIPYTSSKIYSGSLSDGRFYLIANEVYPERTRLVLYISEKGKMRFEKQVLLIDCKNDKQMYKCHYPAAIEKNGILCIIATSSYSNGRGAVLFTVDLKDIKAR